MFTYEKMKELTKQFYEYLKVEISSENVELAVTSLTMPEYAKNYNDIYQSNISNHSALATVGDAFCSAYQMLNEYTPSLTKNNMTLK